MEADIISSIVGIMSGTSTSMTNIMFLGCGLLGMIAHYLKKRIKGQTKVSIKDYFGKNNPLSSIGAFMTFAGAMTGMVMGVDLSTQNDILVVVLGVCCGWTIDSGINSVKEPA